MNLLDKLKLLWALNKVYEEVKKMDKLNAVMGKLSGTKTITGLLMIVSYYALPNFGVHVPEFVLNLGIGWAGVGFAHKFDKVTGILSKVVDALTKANDTVNKEGDKK